MRRPALVFILMASIVLAACQSGTEPASPASPDEAEPQTVHNVLFVLDEHFSCAEYYVLRENMEEAGYRTVTAAATSDPLAAGDVDFQVIPDMLLADVQVEDYDAVILVAGDMVIARPQENVDISRIVQEAVSEGGVIAAIDGAPMLLARAGVLEGIPATAALSVCPLLADYGATCTNADIEQEGSVITAASGAQTQSLAEAVLAALEEQSLVPEAAGPGLSAGSILVISEDGISGRDYFAVAVTLRNAGYHTVLASTDAAPLTPQDSNVTITPDILLEEAVVEDYDGVVIIGNPSFRDGREYTQADAILQEALAQDLLVAGVGSGVRIMAYAGVLSDVDFVLFNRWCPEVAADLGLSCTDTAGLIQDGQIITADNPSRGPAFAEAVLTALEDH
jgi:protease I